MSKKLKIFIVCALIVIVSFICITTYLYTKTSNIADVTNAINKKYYNQLIQTKFNQKILNNTLIQSDFNFFTCQDNHFLSAYANSWQTLANRLDDSELKYQINMNVERVQFYLEKADFNCKPSISTLEYIEYINAYSNMTIVEHIASLLPCKTIYYFLYKDIIAQFIQNHKFNTIQPFLQKFLLDYGTATTVENNNIFIEELSKNIKLNHNDRQIFYDVYTTGVILEIDFFNNNLLSTIC